MSDSAVTLRVERPVIWLASAGMVLALALMFFAGWSMGASRPAPQSRTAAVQAPTPASPSSAASAAKARSVGEETGAAR
jgi:hypothetical protein